MFKGLIKRFAPEQTGVRCLIDTPEAEITDGSVAFRGWVASARPFRTIALNINGEVHAVSALHPRPDVERSFGLKFTTGWEAIRSFASTPDIRQAAITVLVDDVEVLDRTLNVRALETPMFTAAPDISSTAPTDMFLSAACALQRGARILEIGTKQAVLGTSTHWFSRFPCVARDDYTMADVDLGADVDVLADLHDLPGDWTARFDAVVANAVFEHLERPWIAAREVARVLAPGGICHIGTHQTFPIHGYPSDFFRFSKEALRLIFEDAGLIVEDCAYSGRAEIVPPPHIVAPAVLAQWNATWPAYIAVSLFGRKAVSDRRNGLRTLRRPYETSASQ